MSVLASALLTVVLAADGWTPTVQWLESIGRGDLALEAVLLNAQDGQIRRVEQTDLVAYLARVLDTYAPGDPTRVRAALELGERLDALPWLLQQEAHVALLAAARSDALQASHGDRGALLAGGTRTAASMRRELLAALALPASHKQRRRLEALLRRTALLEGTLLVDLGRSDVQVEELLHVALLGAADADARSVQTMPDGVLAQADAAWAAEALVRLKLRQGDAAAATVWVERLLSVDSPLLERLASNVLVELLLALPEAQARTRVRDWSSALTEGAALAVLAGSTRHDDVLLERLEGSDAVRFTLAGADRPLPEQNVAAVALAAFDRAMDGRGAWDSARVRLQIALAGEGNRRGLRTALGRACLESGEPAQALTVLLEVPDGSDKAHADALALIAATRRQGGRAPPVALLERIVARGLGSPGWTEACLRLSAHPATAPQRVVALLQHLDTPEAAVLREDLAWSAWQVVGRADDGAARAAAVVEASAARLPDAGAAGRLLAALPEASLQADRREILLERALQAIAIGQGPAAEAAYRAHWLVQSGAAARAIPVLREAWAKGLESAKLDDVAAELLAHEVPLGSAMTEVAARLLQDSPLRMSVDVPLDGARRTVLSRWARHVLAEQGLDVAVLQHIAALGLLDQRGLEQLAQRFSEVQAWTLAAEAWAGAAAFGGVRASASRVEQARVLAHVDSRAAMELAGQLRVLLSGTPEGDAADVLWRELNPGGGL